MKTNRTLMNGFSSFKYIIYVGLCMGCLFFLFPACSSSHGSQQTPKDTLEKIIRSISTQDKGGFMECFQVTDTERKGVDAFYDFFYTIHLFKEKFIAQYGEEAWNDFQDKEGAKLTENVMELAMVEQAEIEITGDTTATLSIPSAGGMSFGFTLKNERWYASADFIFSQEAQIEKETEKFQRVTELLTTYMNRIGEPGVDGETIDQEFGAKLYEMMQQAM